MWSFLKRHIVLALDGAQIERTRLILLQWARTGQSVHGRFSTHNAVCEAFAGADAAAEE